MKEYSIMDGNEACATAAYLFSEICGIYPITPATGMGALTDKWASADKKNIFNDEVKVIEMQSEAGAAALMHGSLQAGSLSTTFTASQGLLLMIPSMYKMAGEMLPGVIHVAARSLSTHALSIFGDHQDVYATRSTGFAMLASSNVQEAYYMSVVSHLSAIKSSIPFLHFFDGFRTSHEINKIKLLGINELLPLIDKNALKHFKHKAINLGMAITRGTSQTEEVYFQNTEARNKDYIDLPQIVACCMEDINRFANTDYHPYDYYGAKDARRVIVAMGSVCDTVKLVVDELNKHNERVGLVIVRLYRPFSRELFLQVIPQTVNKVAVLDRTKEAGSIGEPLYLDVCNALKDHSICIVGGRYGLSSKNTTPGQIKAVFDHLKEYELKQNFTIGIIDDVTNLSLKDEYFDINKNYKEVKVFGFGSDGMVSASKNILKIIGSKEENFVQGYFEYDSKKSGGVTVSHLRIDKEPINAPFYPVNPAIITVSRDNYLKEFDVISNIRKSGIFLLNTDKTDEEINEFLPNHVKETLLNKNIKFIVTNTSVLEKKYNLGGKINNIMAVYLLNILGFANDSLDELKNIIAASYGDKDARLVENNILAIDEAYDYLREYNKNLLTIEENKDSQYLSMYDEILKRRGNLLTVSDFLEYKEGTFEGGTSRSEKRKISPLVPKWCKENCIECNQCSFVCPHSVIRPFSFTSEELEKYGIKKEDCIPSIGEENKYFYMSVSESNCTGCSLCINTCPGKGEKKALEFGKLDEKKDKISEDLFNNFENDTKFNKYTIKGVGFQRPYFEFCGACAGCGETPYIRTLTQLYGKEIVIANATGCSSIYGASLPCTPYKIPWINSLFEDNAEFGLGIHTSFKRNRDRIKEIMLESLNIVEEDIKVLYEKWLNNIEDFNITSEIKEELKNKKIPTELNELIEYIPSRKVWIIGGDGWAYDIGYGGLDHVLYSNENIKVLILDTEVYSNTGGQTSKSTKSGAVAEFSSKGKLKNKKDLFRILMSIPNVYIASISLGANMNQTLKAFKEANEHYGPSVIIAYSPCIEHGIIGGLKNAIDEEKLLVESGYNILMRYNPNEEKLYVDSKEPDFSQYERVFKNELRYRNLEKLNKEEYESLYEKNMDDSKKRYYYFKDLESKN